MMRGHLPPIFATTASILPLQPLAFVAQHLMANAMAARPSFATRLGEYSGRSFAVDPVDCPFVFVLRPQDGVTHLSVLREVGSVDARIAAPLVVLLGMIDGTYDGDALFFSRDLTIDGDTEAVLALRNAIENADFDPSSVLGLPTSVQAPVNRAARHIFMRLRRMLDAPEDSGPHGFADGVTPS